MDVLDWRPPETAPTDGREIIIRFRGTTVTLRVFWDERKSRLLRGEIDGWMPVRYSQTIQVGVE